MSNIDDALATALLTENLPDILNRADGGDVLAAREALGHMAFLLSTSNTHPLTGNPLDVPGYVRDYLAKSLARMVNGVDANRAMNLKKSGPKIWSHFDKRLAADLVFQLVAQGCTVLESSMVAAENISDRAELQPCPPAWQAFSGQAIDSATLQTWYYELKEELTGIHQKTG